MNPSRQTASEMNCVYWRLSVSWTRFHSVVNPQNEKTLRRRARSPALVTFRRQYSNSWPSGTKYVASLRMPRHSLAMTA